MAEKPFIPEYTEDNILSHVAKKRTEDKPVPLGCQILVGLLSLISVTLLVTLLAFVVQWRDIRVNALEKQEQRVCVNLTQLDSEMCTGELQEVENKYCCGLTSVVVKTLAKKYSQEKFKDSSGARMLLETCLKDEQRSVAKLSGLDMRQIRQQGEGTVVFWNNADYPDKIVQDVDPRPGCIKIEKPGYYLVHSQIILSMDGSSWPGTTNISSSHSPFFSHSLYRGPRSSQDREKLLESRKSPCDLSSESKEMTSYIGAVFRLDKGDVIAVETSHPQNLVNSQENSFFGLYSI